MDAGEKLVFVFNKDFCLAKNSSNLWIPKFSSLTIKEKCEEKTCGSHSFLRKPFLLVEAI